MSQLDGALQRRVQQACEAWPQLAQPADRFARYLAERVDDASLEAAHVEDLYLACACVHGDEAAIRLFEQSFVGDINIALRRLQARGLDPDDLRQALREKLFTHVGGPPKLADYAGTGKLRSWVRVTMLRMRIDAQRRRDAKREAPLPERAGEPMLPDVARDPELERLKAHYRGAFEQALAEACRTLTARERNLLRQRLSQDLTSGQMAKLHGVHRATLKRWLAAARSKLLDATQREMVARYGVEGSELQSVMRLIQSNLDVSVRRMLESDGQQQTAQSS